jgi:hypothetical protein
MKESVEIPEIKMAQCSSDVEQIKAEVDGGLSCCDSLFRRDFRLSILPRELFGKRGERSGESMGRTMRQFWIEVKDVGVRQVPMEVRNVLKMFWWQGWWRTVWSEIGCVSFGSSSLGTVELRHFGPNWRVLRLIGYSKCECEMVV